MICGSPDKFCDEQDIAIMMDIDPDESVKQSMTVQQSLTAQKELSVSAEQSAPAQQSVTAQQSVVAAAQQSTSTNESVSNEESVAVKESMMTATTQQSATASESVPDEKESATASASMTVQESVTAQDSVYTISDYNQRFLHTHSKTTKVRSSKPAFMFHRPRMQMPNKGKPAIFFVEGVNCQFDESRLLCPGRTLRFLQAKTFVVLGCIWIGCRNNGKQRYSATKPAYVILVFQHEIKNPHATVYKCKVTSLYNDKTLEMDSTISQCLIDAATMKFANILKQHGNVRSYWINNVETLGESLVKQDPVTKREPINRPRRSRRIPKVQTKPKKSVQRQPDVVSVSKSVQRQPDVVSVQSLMKQLADTKSQLAIVRGVVTSSKQAVTELSKTVNAVLARDHQQSLSHAAKVTTPQTPQKHKRKRKYRHKSHSPSSSPTSSCTESPSPRRSRRSRHSQPQQFMSPVMMFPPTPAAFMGSTPHPQFMATPMTPQIIMTPPFQNMMYNYQQQNMMYNTRRQ